MRSRHPSPSPPAAVPTRRGRRVPWIHVPVRPAGAPATRSARLLAHAWQFATVLAAVGLLVVTAASADDAADDSADRLAAGSTPLPRPTTTSADAAMTVSAGPSRAPGAASTAPRSAPAPSAHESASSIEPGTAAPGTTAPGTSAPGTSAPDRAAPGRPPAPAGGAPVLAASRCGDPAGDPSTEGVADVDLVAVDLERAADGLRVRFRLSGDVSADAGTVAGAPATNVWQVLMAAGDDVLYAFTVTQRGTAWESALIDFAAASGDRLDSIDAPTGSTVDAVIPATDLGRLPQTFTWWALTNTDRRTPVGPYIGDDCPNGTGDVDATAMVPGEATRSTLSS